VAGHYEEAEGDCRRRGGEEFIVLQALGSETRMPRSCSFRDDGKLSDGIDRLRHKFLMPNYSHVKRNTGKFCSIYSIILDAFSSHE
jgi:hypothetical protein